MSCVIGGGASLENLVAHQMQGIEYALRFHSCHLIFFLDFDCLPPIVYSGSNYSVSVRLHNVHLRKVRVDQQEWSSRRHLNFLLQQGRRRVSIWRSFELSHRSPAVVILASLLSPGIGSIGGSAQGSTLLRARILHLSGPTQAIASSCHP